MLHSGYLFVISGMTNALIQLTSTLFVAFIIYVVAGILPNPVPRIGTALAVVIAVVAILRYLPVAFA